MGMLHKLFRREGREVKAATNLLDEISLSLRGGRVAHSGAVVSWNTAVQVAAVFSCVRVLAESAAQLPLLLYQHEQNGNRTEARKHPLFKLLSIKPNGWQCAFEFREMLMWHLALTGNAFAYVNRLSNGDIVELIPIMPQQVAVRRREDFSLQYTVTDDAGRQATFGQTEIFHLRGPSWNGWIGLDPVRLAREAIGLGLATEEHAARTFANGARISGVLETPGRMKADVVTRLRQQFEEIYAGLSNAGRTAILEEGLKFTKISMNAEEAQLLESRKFQILEMCRIFRVPPHMVAELERSTNNNIEHQSLEFVTYTLTPWLVRWEQAVSCQLLRDEELALRFYAKHIVDELLRGDIASRYQAYGQGRQWGFLSVDEIRAKEGLNPLPDGKGQVYLQPINMVDSANPQASVGTVGGRQKAALPFDGKGYNNSQARDSRGRWTSGWSLLEGLSEILARKKLSKALRGSGFSQFVSGSVSGVHPVAVLDPHLQKKLGSKVRTVLLSQETVVKQRRHPEIGAHDYRMLQSLLDHGEIRSDRKRHFLAMRQNGSWHVAVVKSTTSGHEVYLQSLRRSDDKNIAALRARSQLIRSAKG